MSLLPSYYDIGKKSLIVKWKCDNGMNVNTLCGSFKNNTLTLRYSDFGTSTYSNLISGNVFLISAIFNGQTFNKYIEFTSYNET